MVGRGEVGRGVNGGQWDMWKVWAMVESWN